MTPPMCSSCALERMSARADALRDALLALANAAEGADAYALRQRILEARWLACHWAMEPCEHVAPLSDADAAVALSMAMYGGGEA